MEFALPKDFVEDDAPQVLNQARRILELPPDAVLRVENVTKSSRGTRIYFSYTHAVELDDDSLRSAAGVRVDVSSHGDMKFNTQGTLVTFNVEPTDPRQVRAITDNLSKLVENGEVYVAQRGEQVDPERLREQGKAWYVEEDAQGNKRLKRAWIS
jgi:hypothetical protein